MLRLYILVVQSLRKALLRDEPVWLNFSGIGQFNSCVLYAKVVEPRILQSIAAKVHEVLKDYHLVVGKVVFEPHVTLLKVRAKFQDAKTAKMVEQFDNTEINFGGEEFVEIELNAMEEVGDDGFYKREASVVFVDL
jgi:2'-5' RNA ligase